MFHKSHVSCLEVCVFAHYFGFGFEFNNVLGLQIYIYIHCEKKKKKCVKSPLNPFVSGINCRLSFLGFSRDIRLNVAHWAFNLPWHKSGFGGREFVYQMITEKYFEGLQSNFHHLSYHHLVLGYWGTQLKNIQLITVCINQPSITTPQQCVSLALYLFSNSRLIHTARRGTQRVKYDDWHNSFPPSLCLSSGCFLVCHQINRRWSRQAGDKEQQVSHIKHQCPLGADDKGRTERGGERLMCAAKEKGQWYSACTLAISQTFSLSISNVFYSTMNELLFGVYTQKSQTDLMQHTPRHRGWFTDPKITWRWGWTSWAPMLPSKPPRFSVILTRTDTVYL